MTTSVLKLKFKLETISHETILYMPQILWSRPQSCDDFWAIISLINSLVFLGSTVELFISSALYCSIDFVDEQKRWCPCQRPWYYRNLCKFFFPAYLFKSCLRTIPISLYYVSKGTGWVESEKWQFLLTVSTIYADVGWVRKISKMCWRNIGMVSK